MTRRGRLAGTRVCPAAGRWPFERADELRSEDLFLAYFSFVPLVSRRNGPYDRIRTVYVDHGPSITADGG